MSNKSNSCVSKRMKEARLKYGISQKRLGILAGIDEHSASSRINQYEMGKHTPDILTLQHIGNVLGYPVAFFYTDDDLMAEIIYLLAKQPEANKKKFLHSIKTIEPYCEGELSSVE